MPPLPYLFFFFNDTATTEIYTLSLHDALPIYPSLVYRKGGEIWSVQFDTKQNRKLPLAEGETLAVQWTDRKSTRLNSSHQIISYAVFCLKKKIQPTRLYYLPKLCTLMSDRILL